MKPIWKLKKIKKIKNRPTSVPTLWAPEKKIGLWELLVHQVPKCPEPRNFCIESSVKTGKLKKCKVKVSRDLRKKSGKLKKRIRLSTFFSHFSFILSPSRTHTHTLFTYTLFSLSIFLFPAFVMQFFLSECRFLLILACTISALPSHIL